MQTGTSSSASLSADDITQAGLQTAQQTLNSDTQSDVDYDKVAQMQAMLASGDLQVDTDQLAGDMLSFFQEIKGYNSEHQATAGEKLCFRAFVKTERGMTRSNCQLEQQRLCMIRRDSDELLAINELIQQHCRRLQNSSQQRRSILQLLGVSVNRAGIEQVFSWLPGTVQKSAAEGWWQSLEQKAKRCKAYNEKNGDPADPPV